MKIIGLTGGIGSGKTTVSRMFYKLGIPVYISDIEAKKLIETSTVIKSQLIALLGPETYQDGNYNTSYVADLVFTNKDLLQRINAIIHPEVAKHFSNWCKGQDAPYIINESALIFENKSQSKFDYTLLVTAPEAIRINRVKARNNLSVESVKQRVNNQLPDSEKIKLADFIIENIDLKETEKRVQEIHDFLLNN